MTTTEPKIGFRILTDAEVAEADLRAQQTAAEYEDHKRLVDACGEHGWELDLELDDNEAAGGNALLRCVRCPAGVA